MTEPRTTRNDTSDSAARVQTIVIEEPPRASGLSGWFVLFLVLLAVVVAVWAFTQLGAGQAARDQAIAEAADEVGQAAQQVGDAAQSAGEAIDGATR